MNGLEVQLAARPTDDLREEHFAVLRRDVPDPGTGQVLIRNRFLSLDPGMRLRMRTEDATLPGYRVGEVMHGDAVGEVVGGDALPTGTWVMHRLGWREYAVADAGSVRPIDPTAYPSPSMYLGMGLVAYVGLVEVAGLRPGETVYVSSAAGAVGGLAGQIAKLSGAARVIGSAGSPAKVTHLIDRLGFDAAFDRHDGVLVDRLRAAAPEGIDVYFDNVGGAHLAAALEVLKPHGRVVLCGAIDGGRGPDNFGLAVTKRLSLRGFTVMDHLDRAAEFGQRFRTWLAEGAISYTEATVDGLASAPRALIDLLAGAHTGKLVVRL